MNELDLIKNFAIVKMGVDYNQNPVYGQLMQRNQDIVGTQLA